MDRIDDLDRGQDMEVVIAAGTVPGSLDVTPITTRDKPRFQDLKFGNLSKYAISVAIKLSRNGEIGRDIAQDAMVKVVKYYEAQFKGDSDIKRWIYKIVFNEYLQRLRVARLRGEYWCQMNEWELVNLRDTDLDPESQLISQHSCAAIMQAVESNTSGEKIVPSRRACREVFELVLQGDSPTSAIQIIADRHKMNISALRNAYYRLRRELCSNFDRITTSKS